MRVMSVLGFRLDRRRVIEVCGLASRRCVRHQLSRVVVVVEPVCDPSRPRVRIPSRDLEERIVHESCILVDAAHAR